MSENPLYNADRVVSGHLAEEQGTKPGPTIKGPDAGITVVVGNELLKLSTRN
jgi:hypothetical protein